MYLHTDSQQKKYMICSLNGQIQFNLLPQICVFIQNKLPGFKSKAQSNSSSQVLLSCDHIFYSNMDSTSAQ